MKPTHRKHTHPGAFLRTIVLPAIDLTQQEISRCIDVSRNTISGILHERMRLSPEINAHINEFNGEALIQFNQSQEFLEKFKLEAITLAYSQLYPTSEGSYKQAEKARDFLCPLLEERNLISKFPQLISSMDDKEVFHTQSQNQSGRVTVAQLNGTLVSMNEKGIKESSWQKWGVIFTGIGILTSIYMIFAQ